MKPLEDRIVRIVAASFVIYSIVLTSLSTVSVFLPRGEALSIQHTPHEQIIAASRTEVWAIVRGGVGDYNVSLHYKIRSSNDWKERQMQPTARTANTYVYEILGSETTESIDYQICAKDRSNTRVCTQTYTILVADFYFVAYLTPIFYANRTSTMDIGIRSVNGFNRTILLSISGLGTQKITAIFEPSSVTPVPSQSSTVKLHFGIEDSAPAGKYSLTVSGTSGTVKRSFVMTLSVPDFQLNVTDLGQGLKRGDRASFTITLRSMYDFDSDVRIYVQGLPKGASYRLTASQLRLDGIAIIILSIDATSSVEKGTYVVTVSAIGGGRLHNFDLILVIT